MCVEGWGVASEEKRVIRLTVALERVKARRYESRPRYYSKSVRVAVRHTVITIRRHDHLYTARFTTPPTPTLAQNATKGFPFVLLPARLALSANRQPPRSKRETKGVFLAAAAAHHRSLPHRRPSPPTPSPLRCPTSPLPLPRYGYG
jgi:hypothetical protein